MKKIILASNSPRRRELLAGLDIDFEVRVKAGIKEPYPKELPADEVPVYIAEEKSAPYIDELGEDELLLTADTVVVLDNEILGKPKDDADACRMLHELSGKTHRVITGVCLRDLHKKHSFAVTSEVTFKELSDKEINYYVSHYHPLDKAGAYGIQEWIGYIGVTGLKGSFYNVMGLPVQRIWEEANNFE